MTAGPLGALSLTPEAVRPRRFPHGLLRGLATLLLLASITATSAAQQEAQEGDDAPQTELAQTESEVQVEEVTPDEAIRERLERIYGATQWFEALEVEVDEGVVFLRGISSTQEHSTWAGDLARRTEGVVGVANRMRVDDRITWDVAPAWNALRTLVRDFVERLPLIGFGLLLLVASIVIAWFGQRLLRRILDRRSSNRILTQVVGSLVVVPILLLGLYLFLQVAGLTRLAATVLGGTGVAGLIIGIAFRDVAENFLASVLISIKRPFRIGHLIEVEGNQGYVQSVTTRGTLLMTLEGNFVHVPNSQIYKSVIYNFSANPRTRFDFEIGIDYADSASQAQEVVLRVLREHDAVLADPEPLVLVEKLGASSVLLRVYFWVNLHEHSGLKVSSSVIRRVKLAVEAAGLTMPDDAREVIFPRGVPVQLQREGDASERAAAEQRAEKTELAALAREAEREPESNEAEGGLTSESHELQVQAAAADTLDLGPDLLGEEPRG